MTKSSKRLKILLVQPAPFEPGRLGLENVLWLAEPVALTAIASTVRDEHEVRILDMRIEKDEVLNRTLLDFRPDIVGTTSMTTDCYQAKAILQIAKSTLGDCRTIVGGHHPTLSPEGFFDPVVDALCIGEGEETFRLFADSVSRGLPLEDFSDINGLRIRKNDGSYTFCKPRAQDTTMDQIPEPARELIPERYRGEYFLRSRTQHGFDGD